MKLGLKTGLFLYHRNNLHNFLEPSDSISNMGRKFIIRKFTDHCFEVKGLPWKCGSHISLRYVSIRHIKEVIKTDFTFARFVKAAVL